MTTSNNQPSKKQGKLRFILTAIVVVLLIMIGLGAWAFYTLAETKKAEINKSNELFTSYEQYFNNSQNLLKKTIDTFKKDEETSTVSDVNSAELVNSYTAQAKQYDELKNIAQSTSIEFGKNIADSSFLFLTELKKTEENIKINECAVNQIVNFKKTKAEIEETETSLGKFIIILNDSTSSKLVSLSEKYNNLAVTVKSSPLCFSNSTILNVDAQKLFNAEAETYQKIADISLRQSKVTNNITEFNNVGKDRPSFFTVYFEKNMPIWLEANGKNVESRLTKLQLNYVNIKQIHENLIGKQK